MNRTPLEEARRRAVAASPSAKQRQCVDKVTYGRREARRRARMIRDAGDPVHAYPCEWDHPGRWHVGADWER